ncbi:MAG: nitroreductase family deazaflavin-dependent oxidoreductase [Acidobacteria bacterium]|nr:nitroreductase family deazaflavin-dependent oxidoreductase [Acidobacteriota bacterium]
MIQAMNIVLAIALFELLMSTQLSGNGPRQLQTVGRKSGRLRRTPVGNGLKGATFWVIAEHGRHADWVRNIMANPQVRSMARVGQDYGQPRREELILAVTRGVISR